MKIGIMQPYFMPYLGYWQLLNAVDKYVVFDDVNYINRGWISRNNILMNGEAKFIKIQLIGASQNKLINEIQVTKDQKELKKILKTLECCYKRAPYYDRIAELIENIILNEESNLACYLYRSIQEVCNYLDIKTELILSSSIEKKNGIKGEDKIIDICKRLKADTYYNAIGGKELYKKEKFERNHIQLNFLRMKEIVYKQFSADFVPNLSIIDVMMFNSKEQIQQYLEMFLLD